MTKTQKIAAAATTLRVIARRTGRPVSEDMAWDAISALGFSGLNGRDVLRVARRELRAIGEGHLA